MADQAKSPQRISWRVDDKHAGLRLDTFLRRQLPHLSRRVIERAINESLFTINRRVGRKGEAVQTSERVTFRGDPTWLEAAPFEQPELDVGIVYEDEVVIALNKPAGMPTHGFSARDSDTVANFLVTRLPSLASVGASRWEAGLVHRLDRETSGVVVAAKTRAAYDDLRQQFRRREIQKYYWALVHGAVASAGIIEHSLAHDARDRRKMRALVRGSSPVGNVKAWPAVTRYRRLCKSGEYSLVELEMRTGVTHQLRVHLAAIGHPIVGDGLYGDNSKDDFDVRRHFLHAKHIRVRHPQSREWIEMEAPLPAELRATLDKLKIGY